MVSNETFPVAAEQVTEITAKGKIAPKKKDYGESIVVDAATNDNERELGKNIYLTLFSMPPPLPLLT